MANTERELRRISQRHNEELQKMVSSFLQKSANQTEEKIKIIYNEHERVWFMYAQRNNSDRSKSSVTVFSDAFESSIKVNGYKSILKLKNSKTVRPEIYQEYKRIMKVIKEKTWLQKLIEKIWKQKAIVSVDFKKA